MRKISLAFVMIFFISLFTGCNLPVSKSNEGIKKVALALPTKSSQRWVEDGNNMKKELENIGYEVDMQYAEDIIENQVSQIENMITRKVDAIVVAAIDGNVLGDVVDKAADAGIPVIAYDRLIMNTTNLSYYATFDNFKVGELIGSFIIENLGLLEGETGPFNMEVFGGSPDDNNAYYLYDGAMSKLKQYIDNGLINVKSNQLGMEKVSTLRWDGATAQTRMDNLLGTYYTNENVHAILSPYDGISIGIISSLKSMGYGHGDLELPVVTGQDAELSSIKSIIAGEQTQTVFKDTRVLAKKTVEMVEAVLNGKEVEVNDTESYFNNEMYVKSYLCEPISITKENYEKELIDTGYYTKEELNLQ